MAVYANFVMGVLTILQKSIEFCTIWQNDWLKNSPGLHFDPDQ